MPRKSQLSEVLRYLEENGSITSLEAIQEFGATRLSSIIFILRQKGYDIITNMIKFKNRYGNVSQVAQYQLKERNKKSERK